MESHWANFENLNQENPADLYRFNLVLKALDLKGYGEGCAVVDIGCGDGAMVRILKNKHPKASVIGADSSEVGLQKAKAKTPEVEFVFVDFNKDENIPTSLLHWATHGVCSEVVEHLDHPKEFLQRTFQLFKPDGTFIITVPGGPMSEFHRHVGHRTHYTAKSITDLVESSGFEVLKVQRAGFPFHNAYRFATQLRGKQILEDLNIGNQASGEPVRRSFAMRSAFNILRPLFKLNLSDSALGWQLVVTARPRRNS